MPTHPLAEVQRGASRSKSFDEPLRYITSEFANAGATKAAHILASIMPSQQHAAGRQPTGQAGWTGVCVLNVSRSPARLLLWGSSAAPRSSSIKSHPACRLGTGTGSCTRAAIDLLVLSQSRWREPKAVGKSRDANCIARRANFQRVSLQDSVRYKLDNRPATCPNSARDAGLS